ncbi:MAG: acyltransferase [Atopobiaceae bacterium]|nr:acyltransferase [Atopobiaceae bacterium]
MSNFLDEDELAELGISSYGKGVLIGRHAILYSPSTLVLGDYVRIDDFTIISGKVTLGSYIHVSQFCGLYGGEAGIMMEDFSGLSAKCSVYAVSDDYTGHSMTNPMVPARYKPTAISKSVRIGRHAIVGCNSVVLPGVEIPEGAAVGSLSCVTRSLEPWSINIGTPAKKRSDRAKDVLDLEKRFWLDRERELCDC